MLGNFQKNLEPTFLNVTICQTINAAINQSTRAWSLGLAADADGLAYRTVNSLRELRQATWTDHESIEAFTPQIREFRWDDYPK